MMLEYLTDEDLRARYPNDGFLLDDPDAVSAAIVDAVAEAEGYLAGRYVLPLPDVPPVLTGKLCDIVRYRLWREEASDEVRQRYRDAVSWLKDLSAGRAVLVFKADPNTNLTPEPTPNRGRIAVGSAHESGVFGGATLGRML